MCLEDIIGGDQDCDEGEDVDEGIELDVCQGRMFDSACGILLIFACLWEVFVRDVDLFCLFV